MLLPCRFNVAAMPRTMPLPSSRHAATMSLLHRCHIAAKMLLSPMLLPCPCHLAAVTAMPPCRQAAMLPYCCYVAALSLPCRRHAAAMLLLHHCHLAARVAVGPLTSLRLCRTLTSSGGGHQLGEGPRTDLLGLCWAESGLTLFRPSKCTNDLGTQTSNRQHSPIT